MNKVQQLPVIVPFSSIRLPETSSFTAFSFPKFDFSRALTGRNLLILTGIGCVVYLALRALGRTALVSPSKEISAEDVCAQILDAVLSPSNETTTLKKAISGLNSMKFEEEALESFVTSYCQKVELYILPKIFQELRDAEAPVFFDRAIEEVFTIKLTAAYFNELKTSTMPFSNIRDQVFRPHPILNLFFLEHSVEQSFKSEAFSIIFKVPTLKTFHKILEAVQQDMAKVKNTSTASVENQLKTFISNFATTNPESIIQHLALIRSMYIQPIEPVAYLKLLRTTVQSLYPEKNPYWERLAVLAEIPIYVEDHWCMGVIHNLRPTLIWEMSASERSSLSLKAGGNTLSFYKDIEELEKNPDHPLINTPLYIQKALAYAIGRQETSHQDSKQLRARLKEHLIANKGWSVNSFNDRSQKYLEVPTRYYTEARAAYKILGEIAKEIT